MRIAQPINFTVSAGVKTGPGLYCGFTIRETAGAVAVVDIYDGVSAAGTFLETISLAAAGSGQANFPNPVAFSLGVYVNVVSGAVKGSVRIG